MSAVEKLFGEHRVIERVVHALEICVHTPGGDTERARCDLLRFVTFFREYADLLHHEKEEEILMPALVESGLRWDEGILLKMRKEHDFERHLLQTLRHLALQTGTWSAEDHRRFVELSDRFASFMRAHIELEDKGLYHLVKERLLPDAEAALESKLSRFDEKRKNAGEFDLLVTLGEELISRYAAHEPA
jgi:hemerythrin-like domain-containing protein